MNWSEEADRVAETVFKDSDMKRQKSRLLDLWSFNSEEEHSPLFDGIDGTSYTPCLTQIRLQSDGINNQWLEKRYGKEAILIAKDERVPSYVLHLLKEGMTKEEFRQSLEPFVEWRNKLNNYKLTGVK